MTYGRSNFLSGKNGEGKSSIGTAPAWIFFGTDLAGKTYDPSPSNYEFDRVYASLLLSKDDTEHKFAREINDKGKNVFYVNDVPQSATAFKAAVAELFEQDEFLSLYSPAYFFTQHWTKQREQVMRHVAAPTNKEVFEAMSRSSPEQPAKDIVLNPHAAKLSELLKKHNIDDLLKIHSGKDGQKTRLEKQHPAAQARTRTLKEQLDRLPKGEVDLQELKQQADALLEQIKAEEKVLASADEINRRINTLGFKIRSMYDQAERMRNEFMLVHEEPILEACRTCGQALDDESRKKSELAKFARKVKINEDRKAVIAERKALEEEAASLFAVDITEQLQKVRELEQQREPIAEAIRNQLERTRLTSEVEKAKAAEEKTLADLKESIFILDAVKAFKAKEAELQVSKVDALFTTLKVRLHNYVKSTDSYEPTFVIQRDGKDYGQLSAGEKIGAGLEIAEVLFEQSELIVPCFADGIESYTGRLAVYDQLITGRTVPDQSLKIETSQS
ncbi:MULTISPECIES: ATPase [unclassified Paenibacillus]|uniref:ATPase n=1 Tax=unclassified Paenibacillus TaxID=185978 RepID=UPI00210CF5FD|nr:MULTISPECIES: ATPase [unclassified Paenibacillus]